MKLEGESDHSPCTRSAAESFLFSVSLVFFVAFDSMLEYLQELSIYSVAFVEHISGRSAVDFLKPFLQCCEQICPFSKLIPVVFKMVVYCCWILLFLGNLLCFTLLPSGKTVL